MTGPVLKYDRAPQVRMTEEELKALEMRVRRGDGGMRDNTPLILDVIAELRSLRHVASDALSGWRYIRRCHGDLYGVGWDRVEDGLINTLGDNYEYRQRP